MAQFPKKTSSELRCYFNSLDLKKLIQLNRSYGPHFEKLDARIDSCKNDLDNEKKRLEELKAEKSSHELCYEKAETQEKKYKQNFDGVLSNRNSSEHFLGRKALGHSPMQLYKSDVFCFNYFILESTRKIELLDSRLSALEANKKTAFSELRILNSIIEEKKKLSYTSSYPHQQMLPT